MKTKPGEADIGDHREIQNNVSICEGVELLDYEYRLEGNRVSAKLVEEHTHAAP